MAQEESLQRERQVYETHLEEWRRSHLGKFVLIKDQDVLGFFDSLEAAFNEGTTRFRLEPFFVKQITGGEVVNVSFFGKRLQSVQRLDGIERLPAGEGCEGEAPTEA